MDDDEDGEEPGRVKWLPFFLQKIQLEKQWYARQPLVRELY